MTGANYPPARTAWFMVAMLTIAYIFSYIDRYVLGLLIEPIKADLGLTDEEIGWLMGPAFAIFYATMGLPLGWLVDRTSRTRLIAAGVALWSLATAASGLARSFGALFAARMTVGVGEAVLSPAAFSIIADSFPPEKRGRPIAVYSMAIAVGSGLASLMVAAILAWAEGARVALPGVGDLAPWQATFMAVGLPGLVVALGFLALREPLRQQSVAADPALTGNGIGDALLYVGGRWATFLLFVLPVCSMTTIAYSHGFLAPVFERTWGMPPKTYAAINGLMTLAIGPATYLACGWLSDRLTAAGRRDAPFRILLTASAILIPSAALAPMMPSPTLAFVMLGIVAVGVGGVSAVGPTALLTITPGAIRGQVVALYYMAISLTGLLLGPTTVGALSTRVFGEGEIRQAVAAVPLLYGVIPLLLAPVALRLYRAQMARLSAA